MAKHPSDTYPCTILSASTGEKLDKANRPTGIMTVRIAARIPDGPYAGLHFYDDEVNNKSAPYVARSCKAVGWKGPKLDTLAADCAAWIAKTGGVSTIEISHIPVVRDGVADVWHKPNAIGRGPKPLAPPSEAAKADADAYMQAALADEPAVADEDSIPF